MTGKTAFNPADPAVHPPVDTPDYKSTRLRAPQQRLLSLVGAGGELSGPVFGHSDIAAGDSNLLTNSARAGESPIGERILLHGRVLDENARPVPQTLVEIWQANAGGRYRHRNDTYLAAIDPNFGGCGRTITDEAGHYSFQTVKPGAYPWPNSDKSWRPAHVHFSVFGTAFCQRLITQCYFEGDPLIPLCPIVQTVPDAQAITALTAKLDLAETIPFDMIAYRFDIVLRGPRASRFEDHGGGR